MHTQNSQPRIGRRRMLSLGWLAGFTVLVTAALSLTAADTHVIIEPGTAHDYDLQVATSANPLWTPSEQDWAQGNPTPISPNPGEDDNPWSPGTVNLYSVAVRNAGPELHSSLCASITALPEPSGSSATEAWARTRVTLRTRVTRRGAGETVVDGVFGDRASLGGCARAPLHPGEVREYTLIISLPRRANVAVPEPGTIRLRFTGASQ